MPYKCRRRSAVITPARSIAAWPWRGARGQNLGPCKPPPPGHVKMQVLPPGAPGGCSGLRQQQPQPDQGGGGQTNLACIPADLSSAPPSAAVNSPQRLQRVGAPKALPRNEAAAMRETKLGWLDSSMLKPQKNTSSSTARGHSAGAAAASALTANSPSWASSTRPIAASMAPRIRPRRSIEKQPANGAKRQHHGGQIHLPVRSGQPGLHQQGGQWPPHGHLHGVQHKHPKFRRSSPGWRHTCVQWSLAARCAQAQAAPATAQRQCPPA